MSDRTAERTSKRDITDDFLLCNRCGSCRAVCPIFPVFREEFASARGKVELAEAFFKGEKIEERKIREIFELCLHCMACEESCPSGMRADEVVTAVKAEMARRGLLPRLKRIAFGALESMDNALFRVMRAAGLAQKAPLHGVGGKSPLRFLFPFLGWPVDRFVPLPAKRPFLSRAPEIARADDAGFVIPDPDRIADGSFLLPPFFERRRAADLIRRIADARRRNLAAKRCAYFFIGHAVNHFFPEEAEAEVLLLNLLGIDVVIPKDQACCGAPLYFAGDIEGARRVAAETIGRFARWRYDLVVTPCSSGGHMLKNIFPRLFDLTADGYFEIEWDTEREVFRRKPSSDGLPERYRRAADLYRERLEGKVFDMNESLAAELGLHQEAGDLSRMFRSEPSPGPVAGASSGPPAGRSEEPASGAGKGPAVTYHHPCHLNRGQDVGWQPVAILELLPGHRYVEMEDADRCCGGGGTFTFLNPDAAEKVAGRKIDAIEKIHPDIVSTACPICRVQLMDMINRHFVASARSGGEEPEYIPVMTPVELLLQDLEPLLEWANGD